MADVEVINKLFLELSQFATASTASELRCDREKSALRARVAELEEGALRIAQALGISYEADGVASAPGPVEEQLAEIARLKAVDREVADREHYERSMSELAHDNQDGW